MAGIMFLLIVYIRSPGETEIVYRRSELIVNIPDVSSSLLDITYIVYVIINSVTPAVRDNV